jgi:hypothetical protein
MKSLIAAALGVALSARVHAAGWDAGRVRRVEGSASLQRSGESASEAAQPNVPFAPGDRLFTDNSGRVEVQFGASFVRVDSRTSLEFSADAQGSTALRLNGGGLYIHTERSRGENFVVETPGGVVNARDPGIYRLDVDSGETRLSVIQGNATIDSGAGPMTVSSGQKIYARQGQPPEGPQGFGRLDDEFARWDEGFEGSLSRRAGGDESLRYVPEEVAPYAGDLDNNGSWSYLPEEGYVWHPYVAVDWSPYTYGSWGWTSFGWTWYPTEFWGWAPFHYGRWGFGGGLGWYWIPGPVWGPAWVSWSFGGGFVGWCPLGFHDRVFGFQNTFYRGGFRNGFDPHGGVHGWNFARSTDLTSRNLSHRFVTPTSAQVQAMTTVKSPTEQPMRNFAGVHQIRTAQPVGMARTRPTIGDSVPALRRDWKQPTVPGVPQPVVPPYASKGHSSQSRGPSVPMDRQVAGARTPHPSDSRGAQAGRDFPMNAQRGTGSTGSSHPTDRRSEGFSSGGSDPRVGGGEHSNPAWNAPRNNPETRSSRPYSYSPYSGRGANPESSRPQTYRYDRGRGDGGRDVLRPFFQPFNDQRSAPRSSTPHYEAPTHSAPSSHSAPPAHSSPPPHSSSSHSSSSSQGGHRDHNRR